MRHRQLSHPHRRLLVRCLGMALAGATLADTHAAPPPSVPAPARHGLTTASGSAPQNPDGWIVVNIQNCNDSGPGSLRDAMAAATLNTFLELDALTCSTITLTTGALADTSAVQSLKLHRTPAIVQGRKQPTLTIEATVPDRVINHQGTSALDIEGVRIVGATYHGDAGGCIYSADQLNLYGVVMTACQLIAPSADYALGGAAYAKGAINVFYSTISGANAASELGYTYGGGLFAGTTLTLAYSTLIYNAAGGGNGLGYGGGFAARGSVEIRNSLITGNVANYDGAMVLAGSVGSPISIIDNSTIAYNFAEGAVGGIASNADLRIYSSTIANNRAWRSDLANGVFMQGARPLTLVSSIIALNVGDNITQDVGGAGTVSGNANLVTAATVALPADTIFDDPGLGPLQDNGGQTLTMALSPTSPAIDAGFDTGHFYCDQRSGVISPFGGFLTIYARIAHGLQDIGAYETDADDMLFHDGFDGSYAGSYTCFPF